MILFKNATVSSGITKERKVDILFDDKIIELREDSIEAPNNCQVIDLDGKIVLPGCIDVHTHFRTDSPDWKSHFLNATKAAVSGGITFLADSSCNVDEPLTESFKVTDIYKEYEGNAVCDYGIWGFISSDDYSFYTEEIQELSKAGVVGIEFYLYNKNFSPTPLDFDEILELFTDFSNSQILFGVFPMGFLSEKDDKKDIFDVQFDAVKKLFRRSQESEIHLFNVVSPKIVDFIMNSTKKYHCSYDINPNIFKKNDRSIFIPGSQIHDDESTFTTLIQTGKVPSVSTNSGYISEDLNYTREDLTNIVNYGDLQHMIPFFMSYYYLAKRLTLGNLERMLAGNPAKILGIEHIKGNFSKESDADFIVIDPSKTYRVQDEQSSFYDEEINCQIVQTYIRGHRVFDIDEGIEENRQFGKLVKRSFQATTLNYY